VKNILSGYVERAHISEFQFENQRRTFTSYGMYIKFTINIYIVDDLYSSILLKSYEVLFFKIFFFYIFIPIV